MNRAGAGDELDDEIRFANEDIEARATQLLQADEEAKTLAAQYNKLLEEREVLDTFLELEEMKRMLLATVDSSEAAERDEEEAQHRVHLPEAWATPRGATEDALDAARVDALLALDDDDDVDDGSSGNTDVRVRSASRMRTPSQQLTSVLMLVAGERAGTGDGAERAAGDAWGQGGAGARVEPAATTAHRATSDAGAAGIGNGVIAAPQASARGHGLIRPPRLLALQRLPAARQPRARALENDDAAVPLAASRFEALPYIAKCVSRLLRSAPHLTCVRPEIRPSPSSAPCSLY